MHLSEYPHRVLHVCPWACEDNLWDSVISAHNVSPHDQVIKLGSWGMTLASGHLCPVPEASRLPGASWSIELNYTLGNEEQARLFWMSSSITL